MTSPPDPMGNLTMMSDADRAAEAERQARRAEDQTRAALLERDAEAEEEA